ncbi:hypothetical protein Smp_040080 [Schistosoma mansoni]|uniref:hypothetical protein n=1 Tax=Schistosoma mansoni TaxID=6183 RepID=UPI00022DC102|nr:hypothetical protein Smp_040080 [Schistosoma mansoni]|eukprot:XP_018652793.1 hypothetical protein Smp_040080 [Schistosoma mansoni]
MSNFIIVICIFAFTYVVEGSWNVTINHNPNCNLSKECDKYDVIYINGRNLTSSVHVFITASERFSLPSILIIHSSSAEANPVIEWDHLNVSSGKRLTVGNVTQSYALVFYKMLEYNDLSDDVNMSIYPRNADQIRIHHLNEYNWKRNSNNDSSLSFEDNLFEITYNGTSPKMTSPYEQFRISNTTQHHKDMPHLLFKPGWIVQFDVLFNNLTSHFNQSRFGLQLMMMSNLTLDPTEEFRKEVLLSIDDELTPGNFEMTNILLGESVSKINNNNNNHTSEQYFKNSTNPSAFIQIKPACFIDNHLRTVQNSRNVYISKHQDLLDNNNNDNISQFDLINYTFPSIFYADRLNDPSNNHNNNNNNNSQLKPIGIRLLNVSFGTSTDGFYSKSKFIVWTASFGLGNPPTDNLSSLLIGLIIFSMLIIVSSVVLGILLVVVLRRSTTVINNDRQPILSHFVNDPIA